MVETSDCSCRSGGGFYGCFWEQDWDCYLPRRKKERKSESKQERGIETISCLSWQAKPSHRTESPAQKTLTWHLQTGCEHAVISFLWMEVIVFWRRKCSWYLKSGQWLFWKNSTSLLSRKLQRSLIPTLLIASFCIQTYQRHFVPCLGQTWHGNLQLPMQFNDFIIKYY